MLPSQKRETASWIFGVTITIAAIIGITTLLPSTYAKRPTLPRDAIKEFSRGAHNPRQPASAEAMTGAGAGEKTEQAPVDAAPAVKN